MTKSERYQLERGILGVPPSSFMFRPSHICLFNPTASVFAYNPHSLAWPRAHLDDAKSAGALLRGIMNLTGGSGGSWGRSLLAPRAAGVSGCKALTACHALFISALANISAWRRKSGSADYLCPCFYSSSSVTTSSRRLHQMYGSSPNLPSSVTPLPI